MRIEAGITRAALVGLLAPSGQRNQRDRRRAPGADGACGFAAVHSRQPDIQPHCLGIEGSDLRTGRRVNKVLIHKGTPLPATATREFVSNTNSARMIVFNILEGDDRQPSKCVTIGRVMIGNLPPDVAEQWPVEVTYTDSASGRLTVDVPADWTDVSLVPDEGLPRILAATDADVQRTALERKRQEALVAAESATRQRLEQAVADEERLRAQRASRQAEIDAARDIRTRNVELDPRDAG